MSARAVALTRPPGPALARCELTFVPRRPIDVERAIAQHAAYRALLEACGVEVRVLPASPDLPDAAFVEDAAVVLDGFAVLGRMGTASRRREVEELAPALAAFRRLEVLPPDATLEGGDVLRVDRTLYAGRSARTNAAGIAALAALAQPAGYRVVPVAVHVCLHLKTGVTALDDSTVLANPAWVDLAPFAGLRVLRVPQDEPFGANTLPLGGCVCTSAAHPRTADLLVARGYDVAAVDIGEFEKAEAGVTCLSVLVGV